MGTCSACYHFFFVLAVLFGSSSLLNGGIFIQAFSLSKRDQIIPSRIRLRSGFPDDEIPISFVMAKELMNPLGISHKNNLVVAEDIQTGRRVGWAQIRSLGYAAVATDPSRFEDDNDVEKNKSLTRRDVQSKLAIEEDLDELMWQEFEDDPIEIPNGLASLPWTKEYRAASQAAQDRIRRRERMLEVELAARPKLWELSSVYVIPEWRHQGIGSALVSAVLDQHSTTKQKGRDIYALTLASTVPWYETQFGFAKENQIPNAMVTELNVGKTITKIIGDDLVCIRITL
mmetsp:Transcript_10621/g.18659  ORF Transcript_10621/g.18659 Transcript_10621/m.18659 type:complete len:287 (+) Transcript_10621:139-999(+)